MLRNNNGNVIMRTNEREFQKAQCKRIRSGFRNAKGTRNPMSTLSLSYLYQRSTDGAELESPQRRCVDEKDVNTSRKESLDTIH